MRRLGLAVALCAALASACTDAPAARQAIKPVTPDGFRLMVRSMRGRPLVVNFWATWCDPCKAEMPRLAAAFKSFSGRVLFLGVDVQDDSQAASRFAARAGVTYQSVGDPRREVVSSQNILGLPVTQFYASDGKLSFTHRGEIDSDQLRRFVRRLL